MELWEQQEGETHKSFTAFTAYILMGPGRSLAKLAKEYGEQAASGGAKPPTTALVTLERWSADHDWQARVKAFDVYQRTLDVEAYNKEREQSRADRRRILRAALAKLAQALAALEPTAQHGVDYQTIMNGLKVVASELRAEYGDIPSKGGVEVDIKQQGVSGEQSDTKITIDLSNLEL